MPGTLFFTAPSMTVSPFFTSTTCSVPSCSMYLIFAIRPSKPLAPTLGGDLFHGNGWVRKPTLVDRLASQDQLLAHHEFRRRVDCLHGLHQIAPQVEDRELGRGR